MHADLAAAIDAAWERRSDITPASDEVRELVEAALTLLDDGHARVAEPDGNGGWRVNQYAKYRSAECAWLQLAYSSKAAETFFHTARYSFVLFGAGRRSMSRALRNSNK